jgi:MinD-like ATPase involved in chromosome partitioning or flagellar assembly/ActR/RegA family two-component response regulator
MLAMPDKKILIIDPDVSSRNFIARSLLGQKYQVVQAGSGKEGLIYAWRDRPDLVVIDPTITDITGEDLARKLKQDARTVNMPLIALSSDPSVLRTKSCIDAGYSEYITKSGQAVAMLNEVVSRLLGISGVLVKEGGLLMVFLSAKGGTGTSSICANIAMSIGQNQPEARVVVVDMVLPIGSIAPIVGYEGSQNIVTIAEMPPHEINPDFFRDKLTECTQWHFNLLAGSPDPESSNHLQVGRIVDIVSALKTSYDYVLIDIGRSLSRITLPLVQHADLNILVVSTDVSTVSLTKPILGYMKSKGVNMDSVFALLNRAVGLEGLSKAETENALEIPIRTTMPYLSSNMAFANHHHQPFTLKFPRDTASIVFQEAAKEMSILARKLRAE